MMIPTIHLNGTSREELVEQLIEAGRATKRAIDKLRAAWPNGRDYYVQSADALRQAQQEWRERENKLVSVRNDLVQIVQEIDEQWTIDNV